jgi:hypothetical protein
MGLLGLSPRLCVCRVRDKCVPSLIVGLVEAIDGVCVLEAVELLVRMNGVDVTTDNEQIMKNKNETLVMYR